MLESKKIDRIVITLLSLAWLPLPFFNFDSHHDGLILTTVRLTKMAAAQNGSYPFNQYGPFWAWPYIWSSELVSEEYQLLALRFTTVIFYLISTYILWKISQMFLNKSDSRLVVILFLSLQPFNTNFGSNLIPWPSSLGLLLSLLITFIFLKILSLSPQENIIRIYLIILGSLLPLLFFTRIQVGLLTFLTIMIMSRKILFRFKYVHIITGFISSLLILIYFIVNKNWLRDSLNDLFIFGSTYLSLNNSGLPLPIFTMIGFAVFLTVLISANNDKLNLLLSGKKLCVFAFIGIVTAFITYLILTRRNLDGFYLFIIFSRRFWISLSLAFIVFAVLSIFLNYGSHGKLSFSSRDLIKVQSLILFCISSMSQIVPFFDYMHFWWSSPLIFIIMIIVLKKIIMLEYRKVFFTARARNLLTVVLLISFITPWIFLMNQNRYSLPSYIGKGLIVNKEVSTRNANLQSFFVKNIKTGSRILNLCEDSDVFFQNRKFVSASRFFVYWGNQMSSVEFIRLDLERARADVIVTCSSSLRSSEINSEGNFEDLFVEDFSKTFINRHEFNNEKSWVILSRS